MIVCVPSIGRSPYLPDLLTVLLTDPNVDEVHLQDNSGLPESPALARASSSPLTAGLIEEAFDTGRLLLRRYEASIYDAWNWSIRVANDTEQTLAVLNDDIVLTHGSLEAAESVIPQGWALVGLNYRAPAHVVDRTMPVLEVSGTYRLGGFGGFAFVLAPGAPLVDSRFQWWFGDDDLAERLKAEGKRLGVHLGAPVDHPEPSLTGNSEPWTQKAAGEDTVLFRSLWPSAP